MDGPRVNPGRILTVTPNPSLDLLFAADRLVWDDANRLTDPRRRPGGQGINVARAVRALGGDATAVTLLGGRTGDELEAVLTAEGLPLRVVRAAEETRTFVAVREHASGASLLLNARGPARSAADARRLRDAVLDALHDWRPAWLACCGSLPTGFPPDFYLDLARAARDAGARVVVDCDGEAMRLAAGACDLLVPNRHEAERLTGLAAETVADAARTARQLTANGTALAAVTMGALGAMLASERRVWHGAAPGAGDGSAVGAGDSFLAGLLCALTADTPLPAALARAVAAGAAVLDSTGAALLEPDRVRALASTVAVTEAE